jgi:hypothetical protein
MPKRYQVSRLHFPSQPAKHAYRSIANFCRYATTEHPSSLSPVNGHHGSRQASAPDPHRDGSIADIPLPARSASGPLVVPANDGGESPISAINVVTSSPVLAPAPLPGSSDQKELLSPVDAVDTVASPVRSGQRSRQSSFRDTFRTYILGGSGRARRSSSRTPDVSDAEGANVDTMSESGSMTPPLTTPPGELESPSMTASGFTDDDLYMPVDEVKMPKDIPPGFAGNALVYSKAEVCTNTG